jgi:hemerythrin-like domain-containing protein
MNRRILKPGFTYVSDQEGADHWSAGRVAVTYRSFLSEKNRFCDQLEALADLLPDSVDQQDCLLIAQNVMPLVLRAHAFEEQVVFPYLDQDPNLPDGARQSFERLKFEHIGDEDYANDLCLALRDFVTDKQKSNPETLSWMLRGFFEGLRRHVAFEQALILPLIEGRQA